MKTQNKTAPAPAQEKSAENRARFLAPSRIDDGGECAAMEILTLVACAVCAAFGAAVFLI